MSSATTTATGPEVGRLLPLHNPSASAERRAGGCARPVRLVGSTSLVNRATGRVCESYGSADELDGLLDASGTHPRKIMAILGHSQIGVAMNVYTHGTTGDQRAVVGLVGGLLDRAAGEEAPRSRQSP
jgi:hypothetical protein